jgi:flagellar basal-body rod modification protein FlgD
MTPVSGATGATPISSVLQQSPPAAAVSDPMGKDTFLKLLVAQLKYQDPMNPADGTQFLTQTAQFTTVEKLSEISKQNDVMIQAQNILGASSLVGRIVSYLDANGATGTGVVSSVRLDSKNGATVHVGDVDVPVARVTEVRNTTVPTTTTPGTTTA